MDLNFKENVDSLNSINALSPMAISSFSKIVLNHISFHLDKSYDHIVILCIGTDRSTGDSLGPLIGHKLRFPFRKYENITVLGNLEEPVHAKNLKQNINFINKHYRNPFVIAIDACLGNNDRIGFVSVKSGALKPGAGVNKKLPEIGNMHITGIVNMGGFMEYLILQNTRLNIVMKMADVISNSITYAFWKLFDTGISKKNLDSNTKNILDSSSPL
ncbi:spore protease YyaC [Clostridiisalibacter paucivorans]|uniref:spore protease YyaC n=1 Tax=Clostridiisalibacter paucivorans TaxID=408753 RepID=UPI00047B8992|nr:spore protease YyaC [Clostridiisalibacter paucivorans]